MAEVKWIKIRTDMFDDEKIDFISSLPEADSIIVVWVRLLTLAGKCNAGGYIYLTENIPYTEEMLAHKFRKPSNVIKLALETFKRLRMVEMDGEQLLIANWEKHQNIEGMDKIREQTRKRVAKHRENKSLSNGECNVTVTQGNETEVEVDLDITTTTDGDLEKVLEAFQIISGKREHQINGTDYQHAELLLQKAPAEFVVSTMYEMAKEHKKRHPDGKIKTVNYFIDGVTERWQGQQQIKQSKKETAPTKQKSDPQAVEIAFSKWVTNGGDPNEFDWSQPH